MEESQRNLLYWLYHYKGAFINNKFNGFADDILEYAQDGYYLHNDEVRMKLNELKADFIEEYIIKWMYNVSKGDWLDVAGDLYEITHKHEIIDPDGFETHYKYSYRTESGEEITTRLAPEQNVRKAHIIDIQEKLLREAEQRNFEKGKTYQNISSGFTCIYPYNEQVTNLYDPNKDILYFDYTIVYQNKKWIIKL